MPPIPGVIHWHSLIARHAKTLREAFRKVSKALDAQLSGESRAVLEPVPIRASPKQPLHPLARIRQGQSRWYSTARRSLDSSVRHYSSASGYGAARINRASFPKSRVASYISQSSGRAPFASTLRPNLTGGTLGRTAGGYTLGSGRIGGARFFSHGPACQAQVVQNVSQGIRAFFISGQKAQFDGTSPYTGEKRFKAVSSLQEQTGRKLRSIPRATPGSWIDFHINPTITALTPLKSVLTSLSSTPTADHLNTDGLLDILSVDFSRALKDLAAVLNDLQRLAALGDLPITHEGTHLRVHFPGCDAGSVERLCAELHVQRGAVVQDAAFDAFAGTEIALLFPFAPSSAGAGALSIEAGDYADHADYHDDSASDLFFAKPAAPSSRLGYRRPVIALDDMLSPSRSEAEYSTRSESGFEDVLMEETGWADGVAGSSPSSPSGYQSVPSRSVEGSDRYTPLEYQGFEGIYRFIEELDAVRR